MISDFLIRRFKELGRYGKRVVVKYSFQFGNLNVNSVPGRNLGTVIISMPNTIKKSSFFTLLELIVVLAITVLIVSVVSVSVGRKPSFITIDDASNKIQAVLLEGSIMSLAQGRKVSVIFYPDSRQFSVQNSGAETESLMDIENKEYKNFSTYTLPEDIEIEFDEYMTELPEFFFFPDGSASGPGLKIMYKGHAFYIYASPLTGMINANYLEL